MKKLVVMGSTGSVGRQSLAVAKELGATILGLGANLNIELLEEQIREFKPCYAVVSKEEKFHELRARLRDISTELLCGDEGTDRLVALPEADLIVNAVSGVAGLKTTLGALKNGKVLALANKESLVVAGKLVMQIAAKFGGQILPIDSEHSAIFQALQAGRPQEVKRLIITASGGPFWSKPQKQIEQASIAEALAHPNWNMGKKISIDSATMINKAFEVIEASWLFSLPIEKIDVVIHPQSVVHSMVEYCDNSVIAQLAAADMKGVIAYAINYPKRGPAVMEELDFIKASPLEFFSVDEEMFPGFGLVLSAFKEGGVLPAVLNGANERLVQCFLAGKIAFAEITQILSECVDAVCKNVKGYDITEQNVLWADSLAREFVAGRVK